MFELKTAMKKNSSSFRRSSTTPRRAENSRFDEHGFALLTKRSEQRLHHRCHEYSSPQMSSARVKELCELLSYWNGSSFICRSQIERFIRMGVPPSLRGRVWRNLLGIDRLRESSHFNYQKCLSEVRGPLVDLGVSEYGILSAIATLSDTQNDLKLQQPDAAPPDLPYSAAADITLFRQIALDLQRSFPTHRSLMGESPEAIEGQAKLFRVLIAYARYNPQVGYSQGMSYIAAVLLMQLAEEEAFWALTALLDEPKYLSELFDLSLSRVQHQVKVFDQFLRHRKPKLSQHLESVGVPLVHFVMPWFLTLFTSLPCWDSVLAVWDLIILRGLSAVFHAALTIMALLESRLLDVSEEAAALPLLLRVPVDVAQYSVLVPALWNTEVQEWELKCMNSLVLDDAHHAVKAEASSASDVSRPAEGAKEKDDVVAASEAEEPAEKAAGAKRVLTRVLTRVQQLTQHYLLDAKGRQRAQEKAAQTQTQTQTRTRTRSRSRSVALSPAPGRGFRSRSLASLTRAQVRSRRRSSQQRGGAQQAAAAMEGGSDGNETTSTSGGATGKTNRTEQRFRRAVTGSAGKAAAARQSSHHLVPPIRVRTLRLLRSCRKAPHHTPPSSSSPSSTLPPSTSPPSCREQRDSPRTALINERSCRLQSSVPLCGARESALI